MEVNRIIQHNVLDSWPIEDETVNCILGLEDSPEEYISKMVQVFREAKRVLRKDGTIWVNIGDCFSDKKIGDIKIRKQKKYR